MDFKDLKAEMSNCIHGNPPPCAAACPFHLDIRALISRIRRGRFDAAYRQYRDAVTFPAVVARLCSAPCGQVCSRLAADEAVDLRALELACTVLAKSTVPLASALPPKGKTVFILGADWSGLTAALLLARKKYAVSVFVPSGGLPHDPRIPDPIILEELRLQFSKEQVQWFHEEIPADLSTHSCDACFCCSGLARQQNAPHIFHAPDSCMPIDAILAGQLAAKRIEWYLKTGTQLSPETAAPPPVSIDLTRITPQPRVNPAEGTVYSAAEAIAEAERCLRCDCTICMDHCALLQKYQIYPQRIVENVEATLNPVATFTSRVCTRMIASCNECGLCKEVCPQNIDIGGYLFYSRIQMQRAGALPPAFRDFWDRDLEFSNSEDAQCIIRPAASSRYAFFPGCQLGASNPTYVLRSYEWLRTVYPDTSLALRCCGGPALWAGKIEEFQAQVDAISTIWNELGQPTMVLACPSCRSHFADHLPHIPTLTLYEMLLSRDELPQTSEIYSIFDPCASRDDPQLQQCVRKLAMRCGATQSAELPHAEQTARCCSWGGQIYSADATLAQTIADSCCSESDLPYLTYCSNCRDIFASSGKKAIHILDLALGMGPEAALRRPPTFTQRWQNRRMLKRLLLQRYTTDSNTPEEDTTQMPKFIIHDTLAERMSRQLILEEDVRTVVLHAEQSGKKLILHPSEDSVYPITGDCFVAHLRRGPITYWVVYQTSGEEFLIVDVYSHRMSIEHG